MVFRTKSGQVTALEDCCAHRYTPLSKGTICQDQLEYSYQRWQYGTDGRVSSVSTLPANCAIPENLRIKSFQGLEQDDVCLKYLPQKAHSTSYF
ncbi:Rieske 2Fe-2S domain-containing protein [Allocoleopsis sp.]|uniref:Rieske 2Fe-2S domain-containing protein n=1 Tax=Allocoleopsis sp. TaxID=3088169 RepID=UPI0039C8A061